ncbi:MAG TPA: ROK family transcriptional regulator [Jatrophihabitantaceae bacterium]|jgi:predicted NBD/HSP70 family sugar kinase
MTTRAANLRRVFDLVREHGTITRPEVSTLAQLSRSTVSSLVAELIDAGWVIERQANAKGPGAGSGRPALVLAPVMPDGLLLAIDFGHNHVRVAAADMACEVRAERTVELDVDENAGQALDGCADLVTTVLAELGADRGAVRAAAAGIPGPLDNGPQRKVRSPTILADWIDLSPAAELERRIGRPIAIDNDANLGALGELRFGAGHRVGDFIYVKASHGIGASVVLGGQPYRGATGIAGEIGHTQIPGATQRCRCGNRGCLETAVSIELVRAELRRLRPPPANPADAMNDPVARRIVTEAGRTIGRVAADLCNCLNPAAVIMGGELSEYGPPFITGVRDSIDRYAQPATSEAVAVLAAEHGRRAEILGALALAAQLASYHS